MTLPLHVQQRLRKINWEKDLARHGYERIRMSPELAEALRNEIRRALDNNGRPFDVNVARRVYDLAIAAKDMCAAATSTVSEAIAAIQDQNGPLESTDTANTPESQLQASETFGARMFRELLAIIKPAAPRQPPEDPLQLVQAIAEARRNGMVDVAEELEQKLLGKKLDGEKPVTDAIDVPEGSFEHGYADGKAAAPPAVLQSDPYRLGYLRGTEERYLTPVGGRANDAERTLHDAHYTVTTPHKFEARTSSHFAGPPQETCEHCGKDPRNVIHEVEAAGPKFSRPPSGAENAFDGNVEIG